MPPFSSRRKQSLALQNFPENCCTHMTLSRVFDGGDPQTCMSCHRPPDFGYLYHCTEDTGGALPESEFVDGRLLAYLNSHKTRSNQGLDEAETSSISSNAPAEDTKREFDGASLYRRPGMGFQGCDLRICSACRPSLKDRTWQSLNAVVNGSFVVPSQRELDNRRISDARLIVNRPQPMPALRLQQSDGSCTGVRSRFPNSFVAKAAGIARNDYASDADDEKSSVRDDSSDTTFGDQETDWSGSGNLQNLLHLPDSREKSSRAASDKSTPDATCPSKQTSLSSIRYVLPEPPEQK